MDTDDDSASSPQPPEDTLDPTTRREMEARVETIYVTIQQSLQQAKKKRVRELLATERDAVLKQFPIQRRVYSAEPDGKQPCNKNKTSTTTRKRQKLPLPKYSFCVETGANLWADDQPQCQFVPNLDDDTERGEERTQRVVGHYDKQHRLRLYKYGAEVDQEEQNRLLDAVLQKLLDQKDLPCDVSQLLVSLAKIANRDRLTDYARVKERYDLLCPSTAAQPAPNEDNTPTTKPAALEQQFLESMDSFRALWCRRCFTYDCRTHQLIKKANPDVQEYLAVQKEQLNTWEETETEMRDELEARKESVQDYSYVLHLTDFQKSICMNVHTMCHGDIDEIASFLRAPRHLVQAFVQENQESIKFIEPAPLEKDEVPNYYSVRNYNQLWYNNHGNCQIFSMHHPCQHADNCWDDNCECVRDKRFCTSACGWGRQSTNFFRGCNCKGACSSNACTCAAANRECDPNLCQCDTCSEPHGTKAQKQLCRNDNILMGRGVDLLLARSTVSGWGLFNRDPLKIGDFITEYTGELISQDEADRRGVLADELGSSYLFLVAQDCTIDSSRFGNLARFTNHSDDPNIEPRVLFVRGEQRIGFYAIKKIPEQSELLFNYNYFREIDVKGTFKHTAAHGVNCKWLSQQGSKNEPPEAASLPETNRKSR